MKVTTAFSLLALLLGACNAATITLYAVVPTTVTLSTADPSLPTGSETIEALGTNANGATTYHEQDVNSVYVEEVYDGGVIVTGSGTAAKTFTAPPGGSTAVTYTGEPRTYDVTIVADASGYVVHDLPKSGRPEVSVSCGLDGKGGGSCVQAFWYSGEPTVTTSWRGSAYPLATVVVDDGKNGAGLVFRGSALRALVPVVILYFLFP